MSMKKITFRNADMAWDMSALVLFPEGFNESKRYPTMISVHPFGSCKEQTSSAVYGKALAELGHVVIALHNRSKELSYFLVEVINSDGPKDSGELKLLNANYMEKLNLMLEAESEYQSFIGNLLPSNFSS